MNLNLIELNIKNFCNLEMNHSEKKEDKTYKLGYNIKSFYCFPKKIKYVTTTRNYKIKEIKYFLDSLKENSEKFSELEQLIIHQVEIKNIGNEIISASDFFEKAKLRVNSYGLYLGFIDTRLTPQYINANINNWDDDEYFISFDCIKPNDSIYISFVSDKEILPIKVLGETKTFKYPIPLSCLSLKDSRQDHSNIKVIIFKIIIGIIIIVCFVLSLYLLDHPNLKIQIKVIDSIENKN